MKIQKVYYWQQTFKIAGEDGEYVLVWDLNLVVKKGCKFTCRERQTGHEVKLKWDTEVTITRGTA